MKRSDIKGTKEEVSYKMDLSELYGVVFLKDFGAFKAGDKTNVSLPIAMDWVKSGVVSETTEIAKAATASGCTELLKKAKKDKE